MRLIDGDALYERTAEWEAQALAKVDRFDPRENMEDWKKWTDILCERTAFKHDVADAPTVDAVEVVRCEDCAHYIKHDKRCGMWNHGGIDPYGFCFLGERRTNETD